MVFRKLIAFTIFAVGYFVLFFIELESARAGARLWPLALFDTVYLILGTFWVLGAK